MHRQKCDADEEICTGKIPDLLITHHTTDILAEEELDTFVEFLNVYYVLLLHPVSIVTRDFGFSGRMHWLISQFQETSVTRSLMWEKRLVEFNLDGFVHQNDTQMDPIERKQVPYRFSIFQNIFELVQLSIEIYRPFKQVAKEKPPKDLLVVKLA